MTVGGESAVGPPPADTRRRAPRAPSRVFGFCLTRLVRPVRKAPLPGQGQFGWTRGGSRTRQDPHPPPSPTGLSGFPPAVCDSPTDPPSPAPPRTPRPISSPGRSGGSLTRTRPAPDEPVQTHPSSGDPGFGRTETPTIQILARAPLTDEPGLGATRGPHVTGPRTNLDFERSGSYT